MVSHTHEDSSSNDYTSDSSSEAIQYHKITLKKPKKNKTKKSIETNIKVCNNDINKTFTNSKNTKIYNMKYVNKSIPMTSLGVKPTTENKKRKQFQNVKFYEIGDSISGYKFITDEPPLKKQNQQRNNEIYDIDPFQFDQLHSVKRRNYKGNSSIETVILQYWGNKNKKREEDTYLPIIRNDNDTLIKLNDCIDIEDITSTNVLRFYDYSERLTNMTIQEMLKVDRIKWHPDKLINNDDTIVIVTRLFQIINGLWQTQGS